MKPMNYCDLFQYGSNLFLTIISLLEHEKDILEDITMRVISSLIMMFMMMKMFDWFRTFDSTNKYMSLFFHTFVDIIPFFCIFISILFMFGSTMLILNEKSSDKDVIGQYTGNEWLDMMID